jgi:apolipoprotein N-acyltransferase
MISAGGAAIATMDTGRGRFGIVICHDLDFPRLMREAGRMGVDVLFGPSSDWAAITPLHARMAVFRAVENGCSLVRPCSNGLSLAADPLGSIVASQRDLGDAGNVFSATVPVHRRRTVYAVTGDAFAFGNLAALLLFVVVRVRSKGELA